MNPPKHFKEVITVYLNKEATALANKRIAERMYYYESLENKTRKKHHKKASVKEKE